MAGFGPRAWFALLFFFINYDFGAITVGRPSDATDLAVLKNAQAAGYGK